MEEGAATKLDSRSRGWQPVGKPQPHVGADAERNSGLYARRRDGTPSTTIETPPASSSVATGEEAADGSCRRPNTSGQMQKKQGFGRGAERGKTFIENRSSSSIVAPLQPAPSTARRIGFDSNADSSLPGCDVGTDSVTNCVPTRAAA